VTSPKIGPYFASNMNFYKDICAERGDYTCIVCQIGTTQTDDVAICYATGRATFSHAACLTSAGIPISEDKRARQKAKQKAKDAIKAIKSLSTAQMAPAPIAGGEPTPDETVPVDEAELRATIEAEYAELLGQAIDRLKTMGALIESLQAENRRLVAQTAVAALADASASPEATEAAPEATEAAPVKQDKHLCRVCQKPARKDADTCKLHQFAAPEGAFKPAEPVTLRPTDGTFEAKFVAVAPGNTFVRLIEPGVMCGQYGNPCAYLVADSGVLKAFQAIAPESRVTVQLKEGKVQSVKIVKVSKAA
jgi:hypothetical protein